ncbi:mitochondrial DNA-directed RNA polymerase-like protein [Phyllosticta capitalensis]
MLSRLARPRTQHQSFHLCTPPNRIVFARASIHSATWTSNSMAARRRKDDGAQPSQLFPSTQTRSVATAASAAESPKPYDQTYPIDTSRQLRPLIVRQEVTTPAPRLHYVRGIGGDPYDLFSNLTASLRVRRMDRAEQILSRLREVYNSGAVELTNAHNTYLVVYLQMILRQQPGYDFTKMFRWYMVNMTEHEIPANQKTFVILIKACVAEQDGLKLTRSLRKLFELASRSREFKAETLRNPELFTEDENVTLRREVPEFFESAQDHGDQAGAKKALFPVPKSTPEGISKPKTSSLPALRSVQQKGSGLETVKKSLSLFLDSEDMLKEIPYPDEFYDLTKEQKDHLWNRQRQLRLEEDGVDAAVLRWRTENENMQKLGITSALSTKPMEALMWQWYSALVPAMKEELKLCLEAINDKKSADKDRLLYGTHLEGFSAEKLAAITMLILIPAFGARRTQDGVKVSQICMDLGKHLSDEYALSVSNDLSPEFPAAESAPSSEDQETLSDSKLVERSFEQLNELKSTEWSQTLRAKVGAILLAKVLENAKISVDRVDPESGKQYTVNEPAFFHMSEYKKGRKTGIIKMHHVVRDKLKREPIRGSIGSKYPMVVEPLPWTGFKRGGYLRYPEAVIKTTSSDDQRLYCLAAVQRGDMKDVLHGLTVLGKTAWRVNHDVFRVVIDVWNSGEELASIAPENPHVADPPDPGPDASRKEQAKYMVEKQKASNLRAAYHSQRCFQNFQLEVAHAFKDEIFYFPHNMDFRGRAYPLPALLNHMGADMARGLLTFAKGKELGTTGLKWLKIHLANVYGFDKASLSDREEFAMEHLSDVYDSAEKPLTGNRWWLNAEDPWQCLATCYELKHAFDSPDPTSFVSHLPVHQDGTCNGLQHYAALGGDKAGAAQVNLEPGDKPSDIYTAVADMVKADVAEDAANGKNQAIVLNGKITRKVVKQTVMTNVYGVTFAGAREQVQNRLEDIMTDSELTKAGGAMWLASYVAKLIFKALGRMFNGAQAIQEWLGVCADRISTSLSPEQVKILSKEQREKPDWVDKGNSNWTDKINSSNIRLHFRSPVIWTTPLKMPVVQPYRTTKAKQVITKVQSMSLKNPDSVDAVNKRKQLQAFPPNFIHSLDASHMFLSAIKSNEVGLTFSSVHDSFWTHAADIPLMNRVLRDAFVAMHSEDIIGRLHEEFTVRYKGSMYLASVPLSSSLAAKIQEWRNVGKIKMLQELCLERKRYQLLQSDKEEEREQGRKMVTPGAMYEEAAAKHPEWLKAPSDSGIIKLGQQDDSGSRKAPVDPTSIDDIDEGDEDVELPEEQGIDDEAELAAHEAKKKASEKATKEPPKAPKANNSGRAVRKFWLPVTFPPVPPRGEFDVRVLRDSQYFFS